MRLKWKEEYIKIRKAKAEERKESKTGTKRETTSLAEPKQERDEGRENFDRSESRTLPKAEPTRLHSERGVKEGGP